MAEDAVLRLVRQPGGELVDDNQQQPMTHEELTDFVRDGGFFEARSSTTGRDCTLLVLREAVLPAALLPGDPGDVSSRLGPLSDSVERLLSRGRAAWTQDMSRDRARKTQRRRESGGPWS